MILFEGRESELSRKLGASRKAAEFGEKRFRFEMSG
jgi:hypothetical protein